MTALEAQPEPHAETAIREEPEYTATSNLKPVQRAVKNEFDLPPLVRMQAGLLIGLRSEAARLVRGLRVLEFVERVEEEIKGGISGSELGSRVSGTPSKKEPKLDRNDLDFIRRRDDYTGHLKAALRELRHCHDIETKALLPKHEATKDEQAKTSDDPSCENCSAVRPLQRSKPWRIRAGRCIPCYQYWLDHAREQDRPKELWVR